MKDLFSSFDRFAASFATGVLLLYGVYLIISWLIPWAYDVVDGLLRNEAPKGDYSIFTGFWYGSRGAFIV